MKSFVLGLVLIFAFNEPACDTRTADERGPSEVKPGENPIPESKSRFEQAPPPSYNEPIPTFEVKDDALNVGSSDGSPRSQATEREQETNSTGGNQ